MLAHTMLPKINSMDACSAYLDLLRGVARFLATVLKDLAESLCFLICTSVAFLCY